MYRLWYIPLHFIICTVVCTFKVFVFINSAVVVLCVFVCIYYKKKNKTEP